MHSIGDTDFGAGDFSPCWINVERERAMVKLSGEEMWVSRIKYARKIVKCHAIASSLAGYSYIRQLPELEGSNVRRWWSWRLEIFGSV